MLGVLILLLTGSAPAYPQATLSMYYSDRAADNHLTAWLDSQSQLSRKLSVSAKKAKKWRDAARNSGLKDSIASRTAAGRSVGGADAPRRARPLMERLPGMGPEPFASCRMMEGCTEAPYGFFVEKEEDVSRAVAALVRPWVLLQQARGQELLLDLAPGPGERIINLKMAGLPQASLQVYVGARLTGGYEVTLRGRPEPGELFAEQRRLVLAAARP